MRPPTETGAPRRSPGARLLALARDLWERSAGPANLTYRWLLGGIAIGTFFVGCAVYAAYTSYQTGNRLTSSQVAESIRQQVITCVLSNDRRADAKDIAEASAQQDQQGLASDQGALASDLASWQSIDDMFPDGLPEPTRTVVFDGLAKRQASLDRQQIAINDRVEKIATSYAPVDCSSISAGVQPNN
jgi:hypothetical protein